jgi:ribosome-binding protein aMBF1 (putative translation factor)
MKRRTAQSLHSLIAGTLTTPESRIMFAGQRFHLQVAHWVADLRRTLGISQAELARRARVSQPLIARLEKGDQRPVPTFATINRLLHALGYSLEIAIKPTRRLAA